MRRLLLFATVSLAATGIATPPAQADNRVGIGIPDAKAPPVFGAQPIVHRGFRQHGDRDRHDRRHRRDHGDDGFVGGYWAYTQDFDGNRSFDPDRWNDWWHERPWRAYPRWVQTNDNCAPDRMWWSGSGWHC
jgi:hypothetical protein